MPSAAALTSPPTCRPAPLFFRQIPGYDPALYSTARLEATAADGTRIPVSVVWRTSFRPEGCGPGPMLLDGYGAYGLCC